MKRTIYSNLLIIGGLFFTLGINAQTHDRENQTVINNELVTKADLYLLSDFDEQTVIAELKQKGITESEIFATLRAKKIQHILTKKGYSSEQKISFSHKNLVVAPCDNSGFEDGDFTNWTGSTGIVPSTVWVDGFISNGTNAATTDAGARHTILTNTTGFDPNAINTVTGLPEIPLTAPGGGGISVRLGNQNVNAETERLRYPISVTPSNTSFTYQYAVVMEAPSDHSISEQPRFDIRVYDQSGNVVSGPCGVYAIEGLAAAADTTFKPYNTIFFGLVIPGGYYKKWTTVGIDLTPYIGTTVTIEFQTTDCSLGGHYCYAYIDASCSQLQANIAFCPNDSILQLTAPGGYSGYQWYDNNNNPITASQGGTNDTLVVQNPVLGQVFTVSMLSASGCGTTLAATLGYSNITVTNSTQNVGCFGDNDGLAYVTAAGAIPPFTYSWVDSASANVINSNDSLINAVAGTYYVTVSSSGGCSTKDTLTITQPPYAGDTLSIETVFCPGDPTITLYGPIGFTSYEWHIDNYATGQLVSTYDSLVISNPIAGTPYYLVMQNPAPACPVFLTTSLAYTPPPILPDYIIKTNVFTPDGDGKNDRFDLNQFAYVKEFKIEIFNRWGKKIFESTDLTNQWDGKINGKEADPGVYYWMASYKSTCTEDAPTIQNKGFVHLIRK